MNKLSAAFLNLSDKESTIVCLKGCKRRERRIFEMFCYFVATLLLFSGSSLEAMYNLVVLVILKNCDYTRTVHVHIFI